MFDNEISVDLFAGGGGASTGIEAALGRDVDVAINHNPTAIAVHTANHPGTEHLTTNVWDVKPLAATRGRPVGVLWASPDCTHHSNAKGGKPRSKKLRSLAWVVTRWAKEVAPRLIFVENVPEFQGWGPLVDGKPCKRRKGQTFRAWVKKLAKYGYSVDWRVLDCSQYGAPTKRRRLFIVARRDGEPIVWPQPTHGLGLLPFKTAASDCIDWSLPCPSIFTRKRPLKDKTLWRIAQGLRRFVFDSPKPFILKVNHGKWEPRHESADDPLSTVTASQRGHALVAPVLQQSGYGERKGQAARVLDLHEPLGTLVNGQKHALVAAFLAKHFGDPNRKDGAGGVVVGQEVHDPIGTVTGRDHHSLAAVSLAKFRGTSAAHPGAGSVDEPLPTVSGGGGKGGGHVAEVRAFLTAYYGSDATGGQQLNLPLRTVTSKARFGIVTIAGTEYQIVDIGMRMLQPHELLRAQFGRFAEGYDLSAAKTKSAQVLLIGNSVPPEMAEALVLANNPRKEARAA